MTAPSLPPCCADHVAGYVMLSGEFIVADPPYPREGAALCCATCRAELTYHHGSWTRKEV